MEKKEELERQRNLFLANLTKKNVQTWNGAISNSSTGNVLFDQFGKAGTYQGRSFVDVFADCNELWNYNKEDALKFIFYLRMVTRQTKLSSKNKTEKVQKGQGRRDEAFKRLIWLALYHPETFYKNLPYLPYFGSWKDLWEIMTIGFNAGLDREKFYKILAANIANDDQRNLVLKYMPLPVAKSKAKSDRAKMRNTLAHEFMKYLGLSYKEYRALKTTGDAHVFQKLISQRKFKDLNFNTIPGKALNILANAPKFFEKTKLLKKFEQWVKEQPVVKFNGYPYELAVQVRMKRDKLPLYQKMTIDKQFDMLIETAKKDQGGLKGNVWCALDTSGSMGWEESKVSNNAYAIDVCLGLGVYFAELNTGAFHNNVVLFSSTSEARSIKGTFSERIQSLLKSCAMGSTNFQSVIDLMIRVRKQHPEIPESDFPQTLLVISDMQFDATGNMQTNYEMLVDKLRNEGKFSDEFLKSFKVVWWYCTGAKTRDYPSTIDDAGAYMFSGFDGAILTLLLGGEDVVDEQTGEKRRPTMLEVISAALNQELMNVLEIID